MAAITAMPQPPIMMPGIIQLSDSTMAGPAPITSVPPDPNHTAVVVARFVAMRSMARIAASWSSGLSEE